MGVYRLILALAVLASHAGVYPGGRNPGVIAVISFYILSGYVMTALIAKAYPRISDVPAFFLDRVMRLLPQWIVYLCATLSAIYAFGIKSPFFEGLTPSKIALNAAILPLGYYSYLGMDNALLLPQAWTLGLEITFYLLIPFILAWRLRPATMVISVIFAGAAFLSILDTDVWGYRLLPGTLFIFLAGSLLHGTKRTHYVALACLWIAAVILAFSASTFTRLQTYYNYEVMMGIAIGLPIVATLRKRSLGTIDRIAGDLSYGVFLNHFLLVTIASSIGLTTSQPLTLCAIAALSCALAFLTFWAIERPVIAFRHIVRSRYAASNPPKAPPIRRPAATTVLRSPTEVE